MDSDLRLYNESQFVARGYSGVQRSITEIRELELGVQSQEPIEWKYSGVQPRELVAEEELEVSL
jgi:hypothetical protein